MALYHVDRPNPTISISRRNASGRLRPNDVRLLLSLSRSWLRAPDQQHYAYATAAHARLVDIGLITLRRGQGVQYAIPALRPDVMTVVCNSIGRDHGRGRDRWRRYEVAKSLISHACGDDAEPEQRDLNEYDRAVQAYLAGVNL